MRLWGCFDFYFKLWELFACAMHKFASDNFDTIRSVPETQYIFLDEGGNLDFSNSGSKYFTITAVSMRRPFLLHTELDTYKYNLIEHSIKPRIELEFFHCAEDNRHIRKEVFSKLSDGLPKHCVDTVIVEKRKTGPALRSDEQFYPRMLGYLLRFIVERVPENTSEIVVLTDSIPVQKKRRAIEKAIKSTLAEMLPQALPYTLMHHSSKSHYGLQIADYLNWCVLRKWEKGDIEMYSFVEHLVRSEFDIFKSGTTRYY